MSKAKELLHEWKSTKDVEHWDKLPKEVQIFFTKDFGPHNIKKVEIGTVDCFIMVDRSYLLSANIKDLSKINQFHTVEFHEGGLMVFQFSMV
jgi:hypothetical protein